MSKKLRSAGVLNSCCSENFMRSLFYKHLRSAASKRRTSKMCQMVKKILQAIPSTAQFTKIHVRKISISALKALVKTKKICTFFNMLISIGHCSLQASSTAEKCSVRYSQESQVYKEMLSKNQGYFTVSVLENQ